jgi:hypothetical protein
LAKRPQASTWPLSPFFVHVLTYWFRKGERAASRAHLAIANEVLEVGRYSAGSLSVTMLFGETLTNLYNCGCQSDIGVMSDARRWTIFEPRASVLKLIHPRK